MRFKLLHVRPHIWLFKQQKPLTSSPTTDDNSSSDGRLVFKRSTSLKLTKSDPCAEAQKGRVSSVIGKPARHGTSLSGNNAERQGKNAQVCTVVDAGCTCRATVTSQHKHKRAEMSSNGNSTDTCGIHDMCRPRRSQVIVTKGEKNDGRASKQGHLHAKTSANFSRSPGKNNGVVSRLVCKSSQDVIKHVQVETDENHVPRVSYPEEDLLLTSLAKQSGDVNTNVTSLDVHELECRLRSAGLEEQRRSTNKMNKLSSEDVSLTSSIVSGNFDTSAIAETLHTRTSTETQDVSMNSKSVFDIEVPTRSNLVMSLDNLRASIAQRKLANLSAPQASSYADNARSRNDEVKEDFLPRSTPSSSPGNIQSVDAVSPYGNQVLLKEKLEVCVKHVDVDGIRRRHSSVSSQAVNQGQVKQCQTSCSSTPSNVNSLSRDDKPTLGRSTDRLALGPQKDKETLQPGNAKARAKRCPPQRRRRSINSSREDAGHEIHCLEAGIDALAVKEFIHCNPESDAVQEKQVVSSSSCEIQVLSDYTRDNPSDSSRDHPLLRVHLSGTSLATPHGGDLVSKEGEIGHELMTSDSAVAMVKSSFDPRQDFKESMMEMVAAKQLRTPRQLQQLVQCYLSLNPPHYRPMIVQVFHELCSELFH